MKNYNIEDLRPGKKEGSVAKHQLVKLICDNCEKNFERRYDKSEGDYHLCRSCGLAKRNKERDPAIHKKMVENARKVCKGKTFEERMGKEKATRVKEKLSKASSGENNANFGGEYRGTRIIEKGKTFEEIFGEQRAKEIKKKFSQNSSGKNNSMYGKPSPAGSGNGYSGHYKGVFFRSIFELSYLHYLFENNIKFENAEKRKFRVEYKDGENDRTYFPDFFLTETEEIIEIKPTKLLNCRINKLKFEAAEKRYGEKFKILTEKDFTILGTDDIIVLYQNKELIFTERYKKKFKQKFLS